MSEKPDLAAFLHARYDEDEETANMQAVLRAGDPASTRRDVAAGRAIVEIVEDYWGDTADPIGHRGGRFWHSPGADILRVLAAAHSDHPDYRQEWAR